MENTKTILENLSLEEKASFLSGHDFWQTQGNERLHIPAMFLADGPHGMRRQAASADHLGLNASIPATCFPTAATVANSWDIELGELIGQSLGKEAASQKVNVVLGPGLNIKRNPRCGRNFEYFSEDPLLSGKIAGAFVRGIQSTGVAACLKHYAANNQETRRMTIDALIDERTLREIYLAGFEIAVKEGNPMVIMSSYNKLNGEYTNDSHRLLTEILRDEWGFNGVVVTDWGGSNTRLAGLIAGSDLEMPGTNGESDRELVTAVQNGQVDEKLVDASVARIIELARATTPAVQATSDKFNVQAHHLVAKRAAEESIVLLKNEEAVLPVQKGTKVAVIGDFAETPRYQGAGSSNVNPTRISTALELLPATDINFIGYEQGFKRYGRKNAALIRKACKLASQADTVLLYIGLDEATEAEGLDRSNLSLPANQIELIEALAKVNPNIVAVLSCGAVIEMPWLSNVKGLVHAYLGGQAGAGAILDVVRGTVNPSGKLAESYPVSYEDMPSAANFPGGGLTVEYREGPFVGYRYLNGHSDRVLFPFGFGLSYTSFEYTNIKASAECVEFTLTNTGDRAGKEIVQLYISRKSDEVFRPVMELKSFGKYHLEAGESVQVQLSLSADSYRFYNIKTNSWDVEAGEYLIQVGASSADIRLEAKVNVSGSQVSGIYDKELVAEYFSGDVKQVSEKAFEAVYGKELPQSDWDESVELGYNDTIAQCRYAKGFAARFVYGLLMFGYWLLKKIGQRETANLIMMSFYNMPFRGIAKMMGGAVNLPMVDGLLMMVNGHFFKGMRKFTKESRKNKTAAKLAS